MASEAHLGPDMFWAILRGAGRDHRPPAARGHPHVFTQCAPAASAAPERIHTRPVNARSAAIRAAGEALGEVRKAWRASANRHGDEGSFPSRAAAQSLVDAFAAVLYPRRIGGFRGTPAQEAAFVAERLAPALDLLEAQAAVELAYWQAEATAPFEPDQAETTATLFAHELADIRRLIDSDVDAAFLGDPAARSTDEILICYPGAIASLHHRIAHQLDALGLPIIARIVSELANERTGVDIHPGATIGPSFFIDHGTGVVIGETAIIGARVRLYQHVTLGARAPLGAARHSVRDRHARHPIVGDDVTVYAGATILGRVTIGAGSTIGGNVWLLEDVPPGSVVSQPPAKVLMGENASKLRQALMQEQG